MAQRDKLGWRANLWGAFGTEQVVNGTQTCMGEAIMPEKKLLLGWGKICIASSKKVRRPSSSLGGSEGKALSPEAKLPIRASAERKDWKICPPIRCVKNNAVIEVEMVLRRILCGMATPKRNGRQKALRA